MALTKPRGVPLAYIKGAKTQADINKLAAEWKRMPVEKRVAMKKQMTPKPKKAAARKGARGAKPRKTMKHRNGGAMMAAALASGIEPHRAARNLGLAALASIPARRALWDPARRESPNLRLVKAPVRDEFDRGGYEVYYKGPDTTPEELLHRYPYNPYHGIRTTGSLLKPFQSQSLERDAERQAAIDRENERRRLEREILEQPQRTAAARQAALRDLGAGILRGFKHGASSTAERAANNPTATAGAIASLATLGVAQKAVKAIRRKQRATEQKQRATESAAITAQSYYRMRSAQNKVNNRRSTQRHAQAAKILPFNAVGSAKALSRRHNAIRSGVSPPKVNVRAEPSASWTPAQAASMSFGLPQWSPRYGGSGMSSMSSEPYPLGFPASSLAPSSPIGPIRYGRVVPKASPKKGWFGNTPKRSPKKSAAEMHWSSKPPSPKAGTWSTGTSKKQYAHPELAKIKSSYTAVLPALAMQRSPTLDTSWEKSENQMYNSNKAGYRQQITRDAHAMPIYPHSSSSLPDHLSFSRVARHKGAADSAAALAMDAGLHLSPLPLSHGHVPDDHHYLYERLISTIQATGVAAGLSLLYFVIKIARTPTNAEQVAKKAAEKAAEKASEAKVTEKAFSVQDLIDYAMSKWSLTGLSGFIVAVSALLGAIYAYRRIRRSQGSNLKAKSSTSPSASLSVKAKSSPASSFASLSVKELRDLLKGMGIRVTKNGKPLRKAELVKLLKANS